MRDFVTSISAALLAASLFMPCEHPQERAHEPATACAENHCTSHAPIHDDCRLCFDNPCATDFAFSIPFSNNPTDILLAGTQDVFLISPDDRRTSRVATPAVPPLSSIILPTIHLLI